MDPALKKYFETEKIATEYDKTFGKLNLFRFDTEILDKIFPHPCTLLDLGCGTGRHLMHFARKKYSVTGFDLSTDMLLATVKKIRQENIIARLLYGNFLKMDIVKDNFYHGALCMFSTLGMVPGHKNRKKVLQNIFQKLLPGGRLVIHGHNKFYHLKNPVEWLWLARSFMDSLAAQCDFGDKRFADYRGIHNMPLHLFSPWEMQSLLNSCGYKVKKFYCLNRNRNGVTEGPLAKLLCNGFLTVAEKPSPATTP